MSNIYVAMQLEIYHTPHAMAASSISIARPYTTPPQRQKPKPKGMCHKPPVIWP
jgi:hypothetical protein